MSDDLWERWKRGARVDDLARESGCTRERMRYRLRKLEEGHAQADLAAEIARLRAEVERLRGGMVTIQRAARTLHAAGQEVARSAVIAAMGEAAMLKAIDRTEYTAAASLDSERQANAMLTEALERAEAALADERRHADALAEAAEMLDTHAVAIHDADGKCYSVSARDYARLFDALAAHRARRQV